MIPVVFDQRRDGLTSFHRLGRYLTEERSAESGRLIPRGPVVISDSLLSVETAMVEMKATAGMNPRVADPILHFQISWKEGEIPSQAEWKAAAVESLCALGFADHQYMVVAHDNTDNFHVHIMLSRVHPETYRAHNPRLSNLTLHRTARELEQRFGRAEDHGLFRWDSHLGKPVRVDKESLITTRQNAERPKGGEVNLRGRMERFNDLESVRAFVADKPARAFRQLMNDSSASWSQIHALLGRHGLEIHAAEKGGFTVNVEGSQIKVKASDVFRFAFSGKAARNKTDQLLGPFHRLPDGSPLNPPHVDYDSSRPLSRNTYAHAIHQPDPPKTRQGKPAKTINDLRSLSSLRVVRAVEVDKMLLHPPARADVPNGRTSEHLSVRRGSAGQSQAFRGDGGGVEASSPPSAEVRKAAWRRKMDEADRERRQNRLRERQKERQDLKAEFQSARGQHREALHDYASSARQGRAQLRSAFLAEKKAIRQGDDPWILRKIYLSQRTAEYLLARQALNEQLADVRVSIKRPSFEEWIEERAATGDRRAAAQLRGWRYQDRRNIRKLETEPVTAQTHAAGNVAGDPETWNGRAKKELDWEMLPHDRLRQLRQEHSIPALGAMRWRADPRSGDVTYTIGGAAALVDRGKQITVLKHNPGATRIALEMAIQKYGRTIDARGSDVFQTQLVHAAVRLDVEIVFTDPQWQQRLAVERQRYSKQSKQSKHNIQRDSETEHGV